MQLTGLHYHAENRQRKAVERNKLKSPAHRAGVAAAIEAMAAPAWEIRNSASLAFTALLMRTVGFKNLAKVQTQLLWNILYLSCLLACTFSYERVLCRYCGPTCRPFWHVCWGNFLGFLVACCGVVCICCEVSAL